MKKVRYYPLPIFKPYFDDIVDRKLDFSRTDTTYTKKLKIDGYTVIFNKDGEQDDRRLTLINCVRSDAKDYMNLGRQILDTKINFFDLLGVSAQDEVISKIDVKSAYWDCSLKEGVVSDKTNERLLMMYDEDPIKELKDSRLAALGSLATKKLITFYEDGLLIPELTVPKVEPTKGIYMDICRKIDQLMIDCSREVEGCIYYYWDCIFVKKGFEKDAIDFIKALNYDVTVNETRIRFVNLNGRDYLYSASDHKIYMTRKENKHLIDIEW